MEKMAGGRPVARNTEFFKKLKNHGSSRGKAVYADENGFFYTWDSWHGEWKNFLGEESMLALWMKMVFQLKKQ